MEQTILSDLKFKQQFPDQKNCKKPCLQLKTLTRFISRQEFSKQKNSGKKTQLILRLPENVTTYKQVLSYGWFEFIVDTGSSLGLWLGNVFL
jgi:hypothetical protein